MLPLKAPAFNGESGGFAQMIGSLVVTHAFPGCLKNESGAPDTR